MINFASDNYSPAHPKVLEALAACNQGPAPSYGNDIYSEQLKVKFKELFGESTYSFLVWNGTAANVLGLNSALRSYESILCSPFSHIAVDECGAPERHLGSKLVLVNTPNAKLTVTELEKHLARVGDVHSSQPKVLSLTQSTEYGTVYSLQELKSLVDWAHSKNLIVHMDGARIANAAVSLNLPFRAFTSDIGVDILSFGGTKNGLMGAEAVIFRNEEYAQSFPFYRKQGLHLSSKTRFLAAQFLAYFENELWKENASHANQMARYFEEGIKKLPKLAKINQSVDANALFVSFSREIVERLQKQFSFYIWNEGKNEARLMCSFNTQKEEIDSFLSALQSS